MNHPQPPLKPRTAPNHASDSSRSSATARITAGRGRRTASVALAAALLTACSWANSTAAQADNPSQPAARAVEASIADIPWSQVGPGWTLATWSPAPSHRPGEQPAPDEPTPETSATTLYLIDPMGARYAITSFPPSVHHWGFQLVDWSGDGSQALFYDSEGETATSIDLHTGAQTTFPVNGYPRYTRPDGRAILVSDWAGGGQPGTLERVDLAGNPQYTYPTDRLGGFGGGYLESLDGTQLVLATTSSTDAQTPGTDNGLVLVDNDGALVRVLDSPMPDGTCTPMSWWTPTVLLAHCAPARSSGSQLWEVPLDGGTPTPLTAFNSGQGDSGFGGDLGDGNAWPLPSGIFLQSMGGCGVVFLSRLTPDGHTTKVQVPGAGNNIQVAGATADRLLLEATVGCSPSTSLLSYDPATNDVDVLLGPPVNGGRVVDALPYPERQRS